MKSILIIDTPKLCVECPVSTLKVIDHTPHVVCQATGKTVPHQIQVSGFRKGFCPLKSMPQKKNKNLLNKNTTIKDFNSYCSYRDGWNDCIESILGEEK